MKNNLRNEITFCIFHELFSGNKKHAVKLRCCNHLYYVSQKLTINLLKIKLNFMKVFEMKMFLYETNSWCSNEIAREHVLLYQIFWFSSPAVVSSQFQRMLHHIQKILHIFEKYSFSHLNDASDSGRKKLNELLFLYFLV